MRESMTALRRAALRRLASSRAAAMIACFVLAAWLAAVPGPAARANGPTTEPAAGADVIGANDLLVVEVPDLFENGKDGIQTVRVDEDGQVALLYLPPMKLAGKSFAAAETAINDAYEDHGVVRNPAAVVNRLETGAESKVKPGPIQAGDWVRLRIYGLVAGSPTTRILHVSGGGNVGVPYLGQVTFAGLSEVQAADLVAAQYKDHNYIRDPLVAVLRIAPPVELPLDLAEQR